MGITEVFLSMVFHIHAVADNAWILQSFHKFRVTNQIQQLWSRSSCEKKTLKIYVILNSINLHRKTLFKFCSKQKNNLFWLCICVYISIVITHISITLISFIVQYCLNRIDSIQSVTFKVCHSFHFILSFTFIRLFIHIHSHKYWFDWFCCIALYFNRKTNVFICV